ncbi:hypothetical protein ACTMRI_11235, partial [Enterococcus faecium]
LSQNVVHSDSDLILHNSSVLIDKEPLFDVQVLFYGALTFQLLKCLIFIKNDMVPYHFSYQKRALQT